MKTKLVLAGLALSLSLSTVPFALAEKATKKAVIDHYANIALAKYEDSLTSAKTLDEAINALLKNPSQETLDKARTAWVAARVPYQQTEVYRFGNALVDDWEGRVNAWPLDEGLIDYVDASYGEQNNENDLYKANLIANKTIKINGKTLDASTLTPDLLQSLNEAGDIEANVTTGYHAIEFLLWGQDLNGTDKGAGTRAATDFSLSQCTNNHCERRRDYLKAASSLLIADLEEMTQNWTLKGKARGVLLQDEKQALATILTGMGSLSYGELAGERMKLGLLLNDPEEEHDCFSDNTHNSHFYDALGIQNVYHGTYKRLDGTKMEGPSIADLLAQKEEAVNQELTNKLAATLEAMQKMVDRAETVEAYDQMIDEGNKQGNAVVQAAIDALVDQTRSIERAVASLELGTLDFEGSDSLDNPNAIFQ